MHVKTDLFCHYHSIRLQAMTDSELVLAARNDQDSALEYLLDKYKNLVRMKARAYFLVGADWDDLVQEGMIGLYKAIRDYRDGKLSSFRAFAELCITRQIITAIKTATRQKHVPLNSYISLNRPVSYEEDSDRLLMDLLSTAEVADPVDLVISGEEMHSMQVSFGEILSDLEAEVLKLYIDGKSYQEIADDMNRHVKSIDNALQRVKRKIELHLKRRQMLFQ